MKILVTGGAGFIASHVVETYRNCGHEVVVVDNLHSGRELRVPVGVRFHVVDVGAPEMAAVMALERPDVVNHHAAQTSVTVSARDPWLDARINCGGLLNVLRCCVLQQVGRFIFSSSGGAIYGDVEQLPVSEDVAPRPRSPYGIHKLAGELYLEFYGREHGLRYTVLRYGNVYGPRQDPHGEAGVVAIFADRLLRGERPTLYVYPDQPEGMIRDYVYVEDVAEANLRALETTAEGTYNIAGGQPVRTRELLDVMGVLCRANVPESDMGCGAGEVTVAPTLEKARPGDVRASWLDITRAQAVLGWRPRTSLADGLARTVAAARSRLKRAAGD